jgi:hypothetical protein
MPMCSNFRLDGRAVDISLPGLLSAVTEGGFRPCPGSTSIWSGSVRAVICGVGPYARGGLPIGFGFPGWPPIAESPYPCIRVDETLDNQRPPRNTRHQPRLSGGVPAKRRFALGISYRAKSWTMCSVADAKWSATRNSSVASCYQPSSCLVDDKFHLGSVSSAVKCHGKGSSRCRHQCDITNGTDDARLVAWVCP